jgi:hypothetical protein
LQFVVVPDPEQGPSTVDEPDGCVGRHEMILAKPFYVLCDLISRAK